MFANVTRYPVTMDIDEQELNQGTFAEGGKLCGLSKKLGIDDIKNIGLKYLAQHITVENPYVADVCEYRLTDMQGIFCSNIYSAFESTTLKSDACTESQEKVCVKNNKNCTYDKLDERCSGCSTNGLHCISLTVFHVLWDMAAARGKTSKTILKSIL